jgi:hypothetical protein
MLLSALPKTAVLVAIVFAGLCLYFMLFTDKGRGMQVYRAIRGQVKKKKVDDILGLQSSPSVVKFHKKFVHEMRLLAYSSRS